MEGIPSRLGSISINTFIHRVRQEAAVLTGDADVKIIKDTSIAALRVRSQ